MHIFSKSGVDTHTNVWQWMESKFGGELTNRDARVDFPHPLVPHSNTVTDVRCSFTLPGRQGEEG